MLTSLRKSAALAAAAAAAVTSVGMLVQPAEAASVSCATLTKNDTGYGTCTVRSGQVRLRADCAYAPDTYSPWVGKGTWGLRTGTCLFSIRGVIVETRG